MVVHAVARPALRLGGEWAGYCVSYSDSAAVSESTEQLITESWSTPVSSSSVIRRRVVQPNADDFDVSTAALPTACSGPTVLCYGASMMEPDVLNARAWALDTADEGSVWKFETIFDGLGGERPPERDGAVECPKERTRVQCAVDLASGTLVPSTEAVRVWQERCWSTSPSAELEQGAQIGQLDPKWVGSMVGYTGAAGAPPAAVASEGSLVLALGGGITVRTLPGLLEVTMVSGSSSRNSYHGAVVRRSWAGDDEGRSVYAEVETIDERTGDQ